MATKMKTTSIHIPNYVYQCCKALAQNGLFNSTSEAIRALLVLNIQQYQHLLNTIGQASAVNTQNSINAPQEQDAKNFRMISVKIPKTLLQLLEYDMQKIGLQNRSEYVRVAILNMLKQSLLQQ